MPTQLSSGKSDTVRVNPTVSSTSAQVLPRSRYKTTPLPMRQMVPMAFVLLSDSLCATVLSPFIGLYVAFLKDIPPDKAGYLSGMLMATFMIGQVVSAKAWGRISDVYGRRLPLIFGLLTSGLMMLCFGLSTSVWQCAIFRFLQGIFNGNILVAKTMMAEITDQTNETRGFSFVSFCFGFGNLIGPVIGGLLYNPSGTETLHFLHLDPNGTWGKYPALLPCLVIFVYSNVGMVVCTLYVQESNPNAKPLPSFIRLLPCFWHPPQQFVHPPLVEIVEDEVVVVDIPAGECIEQEDCRLVPSISESFLPMQSFSPCASGDFCAVMSRNNTPPPSTKKSDDRHPLPVPSSESFGYKQAFNMAVTRCMLITYMVMCGSDSIARECLPLWCISSSDKGGLDLSSDKVGFILLVNSIPLFVANFTFSLACSKYDDVMAVFRLGVFIAGIAVFFLPLTTYFSSGWAAIMFVVACSFSRQFFCTWAYSINTMFTARAAPPGKVGAIMGINQSCGAVTRALVPLTSTPLFAWSISGNNFFPFNHALVFIISTSGFWWCAARSYAVRSVPASTILQLVDVSLWDILAEKFNRIIYGSGTESA